MARLLSFVAVLGALMAALEVAVRGGALNALYFPPPSSVFATLFGLLGTQTFWNAFAMSMTSMGVGFALAAMIAVPVGTAMGQWRQIRQLLEPIVDSLRPMPSAAVIPVSILLLGLGFEMKTAVVVFGSLWPIIINTMDGIRGVDSLLIDTGRLLQLDRLALLRRVILPAALPSIFSGLRISLGIALILTVTAEMIAGTDGLGYFILDAQRSFNFREMFAAILALGVIGSLLTQVFSVIERRVLFWHVSVRKDLADVDVGINERSATFARSGNGESVR
jgi:ABC-type nitrate/sulfonate/bicarbonate transport system permease component